MLIPIISSVFLYLLSIISIYYTYIINKKKLVYLFNCTNILNCFSWFYIKYSGNNNYIYTYIFYNIVQYIIWNCIINYILYYWYNKYYYDFDQSLYYNIYDRNFIQTEHNFDFIDNKQNWKKINELNDENNRLRNEIKLLKKNNII